MKGYLLVLILFCFALVGCDGTGATPEKTVPCPYKSQSACQERERFFEKKRLYLDSLEWYSRCLLIYRGTEVVLERCGNRPEWRDFVYSDRKMK